ncbi:alpha-amylase family glycosyl hydrolase [Clostridium sp. AN503]|uniref:alpha-amylase family glycosyl hydrolase n=1 Tax=Clostridium sp. AN503 TaxID=3160598 RepID=UPI00345AFA00
MKKGEQTFRARLERHLDELKWLYMELYDDESQFAYLLEQLHQFYEERKPALKRLDERREQDGDWYRKPGMTGMMLYVEQFAGTLAGVREKLDYIRRCGVNYLHLMPLLDTPEGRSDGGYAVADFRKVQPKLGTMEDLETLADACRRRGISLCLDFVMNHTSEDHEWAKRARAGEKEYQDRYFFFGDGSVPAQYERTVPQVFPTTAPGNFTWLPETGHYVMTTFYPYQWDLNYRNPVVFGEMMFNLLYLANRGIDVIRIDAVPYIWKQLGTNCRNLPQVHTIVRMMRMICEIVCPGTVLLGEVVMEPDKVAPYFGTVEKPECHMLYNVTTMATTWHTLAARDVRLLKRQMEIVGSLPPEYTFLNYLRCHDDIGWGLDYPLLKTWGMEQVPHKKFLNDYFTGKRADSVSRGELYNEDPATGDARFCGTSASMCGIEKAGFENDQAAMETAIRTDVMLHAFMLFLSGIPMIYSGDEIGQVNDYSYHDDPLKAADSRYIHRGSFQWDLVGRIDLPGTVQNGIFHGLRKLEMIRAQQTAFDASASFGTLDTGDDAVLGLVRESGGERIIGVFNFSGQQRNIRVSGEEGSYEDLMDGAIRELPQAELEAYGFCWLKRLEPLL